MRKKQRKGILEPERAKPLETDPSRFDQVSPFFPSGASLHRLRTALGSLCRAQCRFLEKFLARLVEILGA